MKINFTQKLVSFSISLSFSEMETLEDMLQMAALEASDNAEKATKIKKLSETFSIEIESDLSADIIAVENDKEAPNESIF